MRRRYAFVMLLAVGARLGAQSADEDLRKAKLAAERLHLPANSQVQPVQKLDGLAADDQKKRLMEKLNTLIAVGANRLVKNKPYSAEATTEAIQVLADGNRIMRHNVTKYYRDHAGRTRREQTIEALGPSSPVGTVQMIVISDPVAAVDYILDPVRKTLRKSSRYESAAKREETTAAGSESLGKRTIEGLECTGTRKTTTIPAGEIGNERAIAVVTETWYSEAIEALVYSTTSDPRFGQTTYSLRNVVLADPPPQLFEAPSGYTVQQ